MDEKEFLDTPQPVKIAFDAVGKNIRRSPIPSARGTFSTLHTMGITFLLGLNDPRILNLLKTSFPKGMYFIRTPLQIKVCFSGQIFRYPSIPFSPCKINILNVHSLILYCDNTVSNDFKAWEQHMSLENPCKRKAQIRESAGKESCEAPGQCSLFNC